MKANELLNDIYVYFNCFDGSKIIVKVTGFNDNIVYGISEYGTHWCHISKIEPIPLTPEILKKNGFKPYIPENHLETVYACQDVSKAVANELYALWTHQDGSFYLLLRVDGKDMVRMDVHYVHQLQHALRLCGIDKTIELI